MKLLVLNGANINFLGIREPNIYGAQTYDDLKRLIAKAGNDFEVQISEVQSNHEGDLVDEIQKAYFEKTDGIVINPGAYTHTSIAIADALKAVRIPYVEVHISKVENREDYRQISTIRENALATITGKGIDGYYEAIKLLKENLSK